MMTRIYILLLALVCASANLFAATVDSIGVYSAAMDKQIECRVITPSGSTQGQKFPVVYLLHGYNGKSGDWVTKYATKELADQYSVIIVAPDGGHSSWYWDSPIDSTFRYESFVAEELVEYVDANYPTIADRKARAICGLSMGGHGALYLSIRHQDTYGAVGSMSGGVDIRPFPERWNMSKRIGSKEEYPEYWDEFTVMGQLYKLTPNSLKILIDCGVDDFFFDVNVALSKELDDRGIPHRFTYGPGAHTLGYWQESLLHNVLFFSRFFETKK